MSGGSQHNPNGRQSQLGSGWSPLQLQMANLLARAPQAHMASERGVTWHTPTPPPHLYHVPAPSPPDPLQALKSAGGNSVFRHTTTPPELYRHTPTPPDKHLMRHTPSPGDIKASAALPPVDLYMPPSREKLRAEELMAYSRVGVDLSLGGGRAANGAATSPAPPSGPAPPAPAPAGLSVRDAPTINSLIARAAPRPPHARVDALLERLAPAPAPATHPAPAPASPHSVIVHPRAAVTPSPPSSNEDSADSCGAPPGSKRKRKPERTVRVSAVPPPPAPPAAAVSPPAPAPAPPAPPRVSPAHSPHHAPATQALPHENGDVTPAKLDGPEEKPASPRPDQSHTRRKTRSGSAETIDDIAAMIADTDSTNVVAALPAPTSPVAVTVDKLHSVLASPEPVRSEPACPEPAPPAPSEQAAAPPEKPAEAPVAPPVPAAAPAAPASPPAPAAAPRRRSARNSNPEAPNVPVESPSEAKPAEPEASDARTAEPAAASFVEVENQLEKMFAGLEEEPGPLAGGEGGATTGSGGEAARRRAGARGARRTHAQTRHKGRVKRIPHQPHANNKDAYDSGSNTSSTKSRGPYIQIRGRRESPTSVTVMNAGGWCAEEEEPVYRGVRLRGLHNSTLGLRYDATTPDASWLCAFCHTGPHAHHLGDLFGPYPVDTDCDEYRSLDEASRSRWRCGEVWVHEGCAVWAPGVVAAGARVWGLGRALCAAATERCALCDRDHAALPCAARACRATAHLPCARTAAWLLDEHAFTAYCPNHRPHT